jgi:glycosyltransferase involved in cell wall biosynthesis
VSSTVRFSVVVPTHDRAHLLPLALASLMRQTVTDFEVIVVDDGGRGRHLRPDDPRVRVIAQPQAGAAGARNTGIRAAVGAYVTFLDDDDEFTPRRLEIAEAALRQAPIALCWKAGLDRGDLRWTRELTGPVAGVLLEAPVPQLGSAVVRSDLVKPLDPTFAVSEDVEWWVRMSEVAPVHTVAEVGYLIRDHSGTRQRDRTAERLEARLRLLEVHEQYFRRYPRAAAYQWLRASGLASDVGEWRQAARAAGRSVRAVPSPRPLVHLLRSALSRATPGEQ